MTGAETADIAYLGKDTPASTTLTIAYSYVLGTTDNPGVYGINKAMVDKTNSETGEVTKVQATVATEGKCSNTLTKENVRNGQLAKDLSTGFCQLTSRDEYPMPVYVIDHLANDNAFAYCLCLMNLDSVFLCNLLTGNVWD